MDFTYDSYKSLLRLLIENGYTVSSWHDWNAHEKTAILRHDIDISLKSAVAFAELENSVLGICGSYFILLSTNFYNIFSKESKAYLQRIIELGGEIGLHFDDTQYAIKSIEDYRQQVAYEAGILSDVIGGPIRTLTMHRISRKVLDGNYSFPGLINCYSQEYFSNMKYISDSRRCWKVNVKEMIQSNLFPRLQILTHPIWYYNPPYADLEDAIYHEFIRSLENEYTNFSHNISNFASIMDTSKFELLMKHFTDARNQMANGCEADEL